MDVLGSRVISAMSREDRRVPSKPCINLGRLRQSPDACAHVACGFLGLWGRGGTSQPITTYDTRERECVIPRSN
jgi:hypothetical protein